MAFSLIVSATAQTGSTITTTATDVSGIKPQRRTFSLSGIYGTAIQPGDVVQLWGSNDGGTTFQPLRQGANNPVQMTFSNPEVIIDDDCDHYATQRLSVGTGSTLNRVGLNGEPTSRPSVQFGTTTLVAGTQTVTGVVLTTTSVILTSMRDPGAGAITGFGAFDTPVASRNVAAGSFVINAIDDAKGVIATAVPTVDWIIVG